jgi:energy-coupling factor transporter ATP-binding protein EcfA2
MSPSAINLAGEKPAIPAAAELHQFVKVEFHRFKALGAFTLNLRHFNILVGPNNAGKSTVLAAFRILATALRKANVRGPEVVRGPLGDTFGYAIDLTATSVAEENIFHNYDDSEPAKVVFKLSNKNELMLYFPEKGACYLIASQDGRHPKTAASFRANFNCPIGFVPILGPVEHHENLFEKEAARRALFNYNAARNFRNIWYYYPDKFDEFRRILKETWPGMDINKPEVDFSHSKPRLCMFCPEDRIPREIFWAGFGFQVWCQMLTHLVQSSEKSLFLIDEPDIYLHSDLQRQLLSLLRNLGPDILIATHSTEIITEAEPDDIVLVNKKRQHARRINNPSQLAEVFSSLGSNLNPILTQLAKTRKVIFVEGKDFQILGKFAHRLGIQSAGNRSNFAVVPIEGFNPERVKNLKLGMETTIGGKIKSFLILDRDYRSDKERESITKQCEVFCDHVVIHERKEIENYLLIHSALDRTIIRRIEDYTKRTGADKEKPDSAEALLAEYSISVYSYVIAQHLARRRAFELRNPTGIDEGTFNEETLNSFNQRWELERRSLEMISGKEALSHLNKKLQEKIGISITPTSIIEAMPLSDVPEEMKNLVRMIGDFADGK